MDIVDLMCSNANVYIRKVVFKKNKIIHLMLIEAFQWCLHVGIFLKSSAQPEQNSCMVSKVYKNVFWYLLLYQHAKQTGSLVTERCGHQAGRV